MIVAGVWAVAATAIAVIALVDARGEDSSGSSSTVPAEVRQAQRRLERRLSNLEERLGTLATTDDAKRLEERLRAVENDVRGGSEGTSRVDERISELERRVRELEQERRTMTGP